MDNMDIMIRFYLNLHDEIDERRLKRLSRYQRKQLRKRKRQQGDE